MQGKNQRIHKKKKTAAFPWRRKTEEPLGEMDQYEDQSKDILNSILKEELWDSDSGALIEELQLYEQTRFC